jgi:hypothetical protein
MEGDLISELCEKSGINGPAHTLYFGDELGQIVFYQAVRGPVVWFTSGYERVCRIWPQAVMNTMHGISLYFIMILLSIYIYNWIEELNTLLFKSVQKFIRQTCRFNNYYPQP